MATNKEMLDLYITAEQSVLAGKSYTIAGRTVAMEDLQWIQRGRREYELRVNAESGASGAGGNSAVATWNNHVNLVNRDSFGRNIR